MAEGKARPTENPHKGHRERVRRRFLDSGMDRMEEHVKLELLLFYAIPHRDTNPIAHALLDRFGSISNVFDAPLEELVKVKGMGETSATLLKMVPDLARAYLHDKEKGKKRLFSTEEAGAYLKQMFVGRTNETLVVAALDNTKRVLYCEALYEGSLDTLPIYIKRIVEIAVRYNAASILLAHNHPSGELMPSQSDIDSTIQVYHALKVVQIMLEDHFIVTDNGFLSMFHSGFLNRIVQEEEAEQGRA